MIFFGKPVPTFPDHALAHPPWASTTLRQETESCALLLSRHACICGGLPTNCEHNDSASLRHATFSCMLGATCAMAWDRPASNKTLAIAAETLPDFFQAFPVRTGHAVLGDS